MARKTNRALSALLYLIFLAILLVVALEFALPLFGFSEPENTIAVRADRELHHGYLPDSTYVRELSALDGGATIEVAVNSLGMRGPEIDPEHPGLHRILLLGDSFLQADEIPWDSTLGVQLARELDGEQVDVIQHGMSSWSPLLFWNWMERRGYALNPDRVVLFLVINDFYTAGGMSDPYYEQQTVFDSTGTPVEFDVEIEPEREEERGGVRSVKRWLRDTNLHFFLYRLLGQLRAEIDQLTQREFDTLLATPPPALKDSLMMFAGIDTLSQIYPYLHELIKLTQDTSLWDEQTWSAVERSMSYVREIQRDLGQHGATLHLTLIPLSWNISTGENRYGREFYRLAELEKVVPMGGIEEYLKAFAEREGIDYIDLKPYLKRAANESERELYYPSDGHWTGRAHQAVARCLADTLRPALP